MNTLSILPLDVDIDFIIQKSGVTNHFGYEAKEDGIHFRYRLDDYDVVQEAITNYETEYLEIAIPAKIAEVTALRKQKVQGFTFGGTWLNLDLVAIANLTGVTVGLERHPDVPHINWQVPSGQFISIPRDTMLAIADAAFMHVQGCFDNQKALIEHIQSCETMTALNSIDIESGWPPDYGLMGQ